MLILENTFLRFVERVIIILVMYRIFVLLIITVMFVLYSAISRAVIALNKIHVIGNKTNVTI